MAERSASGILTAWGIVLLVGLILVGASLLSTSSAKELGFNERSAILALRMIAAAEKTFRDGDLDENDEPDYWTADLAGLAALKTEVRGKPVPLLPAGLARSDPQPLAPGGKKPIPFCGYHYAAIREAPPEEGEPATHPSRFAFCAYPAEYGHTGRETFVIDQRGIVHSYDGQGKPPTAWPAQAEPVTRLVEE